MPLDSPIKSLKDDFARLTARLNTDGFAEAVILRLRKADRGRLAAVAIAGAAGAGVAASQMGSLVKLSPVAAQLASASALIDTDGSETSVAKSLSLLSETVAHSSMLSPELLAATALAIAIGATAIVLQGSR